MLQKHKNNKKISTNSNICLSFSFFTIPCVFTAILQVSIVFKREVLVLVGFLSKTNEK